jgi:hypothetical protein
MSSQSVDANAELKKIVRAEVLAQSKSRDAAGVAHFHCITKPGFHSKKIPVGAKYVEVKLKGAGGGSGGSGAGGASNSALISGGAGGGGGGGGDGEEYGDKEQVIRIPLTDVTETLDSQGNPVATDSRLMMYVGFGGHGGARGLPGAANAISPAGDGKAGGNGVNGGDSFCGVVRDIGFDNLQTANIPSADVVFAQLATRLPEPFTTTNRTHAVLTVNTQAPCNYPVTIEYAHGGGAGAGGAGGYAYNSGGSGPLNGLGGAGGNAGDSYCAISAGGGGGGGHRNPALLAGALGGSLATYNFSPVLSYIGSASAGHSASMSPLGFGGDGGFSSNLKVTHGCGGRGSGSEDEVTFTYPGDVDINNDQIDDESESDCDSIEPEDYGLALGGGGGAAGGCQKDKHRCGANAGLPHMEICPGSCEEIVHPADGQCAPGCIKNAQGVAPERAPGTGGPAPSGGSGMIFNEEEPLKAGAGRKGCKGKSGRVCFKFIFEGEEPEPEVTRIPEIPKLNEPAPILS